jgi:transposase
MVRAVRDGEPIRSVAKRFGVSVGTVHFWFERCRGERLDRCDFDDRKSGAPRPWNRVSIATERQVLSIRES